MIVPCKSCEAAFARVIINQSCSVSRHISNSRHYFLSLGLEGLKSRSRLGALKLRKMAMPRSHFFLVWNYISYF